MGEGVVVRPDQVSLGVLVTAVPRDVVDAAVSGNGVGAKRSDGKLPAHVTAYLTMAMCLFAEDDYTEVATKVTGSLSRWRCLLLTRTRVQVAELQLCRTVALITHCLFPETEPGASVEPARAPR
jgi:Insertion element 4 transposase N-terminal